MAHASCKRESYESFENSIYILCWPVRKMEMWWEKKWNKELKYLEHRIAVNIVVSLLRIVFCVQALYLCNITCYNRMCEHDFGLFKWKQHVTNISNLKIKIALGNSLNRICIVEKLITLPRFSLSFISIRVSFLSQFSSFCTGADNSDKWKNDIERKEQGKWYKNN